MRSYAEALADNIALDRYAAAQAIRIAVWGKPDDMNRLRPSQPRRGPREAHNPDDDEFDETGLAEELASFGLIEVPRDE